MNAGFQQVTSWWMKQISKSVRRHGSARLVASPPKLRSPVVGSARIPAPPLLPATQFFRSRIDEHQRGKLDFFNFKRTGMEAKKKSATSKKVTTETKFSKTAMLSPRSRRSLAWADA
jgi:hypothetical protein